MIGEIEHDLRRGEELRFGRRDRDDIIGLDEGDPCISRQAGAFNYEQGWRLRNTSKHRSLAVEYPHVVRHLILAPGESVLLEGPGAVIVVGLNLEHPLRFVVPAVSQGSDDETESTESEGTFVFSPEGEDRRALVALAAGYLRRWPRHDEQPLFAKEAAELLSTAAVRALTARTTDTTEKAVSRRIEKLKVTAEAATGIEFRGENASRRLVEMCIDFGLLRVVDLTLLAERPHPKRPTGSRSSP